VPAGPITRGAALATAPVALATLLALAICAGCAPSGAAATAPTPTIGAAATTGATGATGATAAGGGTGPAGAGLPAGSPTVTVEVGTAPPLRLEVADTEAERERGLMDRSEIPADGGMLFIFDTLSNSAFYMYRTLIPLSIAFVRDDRVVSVREMTPCPDADPARCPLYLAGAAYTSAIEARGGTFSGHPGTGHPGTRPGDRVTVDSP
jgi:uncharacterized protein